MAGRVRRIPISRSNKKIFDKNIIFYYIIKFYDRSKEPDNVLWPDSGAG